jgi:hypothetical protein
LAAGAFTSGAVAGAGSAAGTLVVSGANGPPEVTCPGAASMLPEASKALIKTRVRFMIHPACQSNAER